MISRTGKLMSWFGRLSEQLRTALDVNDAILDGEIIMAAGAPGYVAFDLLWVDGPDLRRLPLTERRQRLQNVLPKRSTIVFEALLARARGEFYELMRAHDLEGVVAKRLNDPYAPRARWFKIVNPYYSQKEAGSELFDRSWRHPVDPGDRRR